MPKKQLLPPTGDAHKREVSVNLRFSVADHVRLKRVADYSDTSVASLLYYVTMNTTLPLMEQEVARANATERSQDHSSNGSESISLPVESPTTRKA